MNSFNNYIILAKFSCIAASNKLANGSIFFVLNLGLIIMFFCNLSRFLVKKMTRTGTEQSWMDEKAMFPTTI